MPKTSMLSRCLTKNFNESPNSETNLPLVCCLNGESPTPRQTVSGTLTLSALLLEPPGGFSNDRISQPMEKWLNPMGRKHGKTMEKFRNLMLNKKNTKHPTTTSQSKWIANNSAPMKFLWLLTFTMQSTMPWYLTHAKVVPCRSFALFGNRKISRNEKQRGGHI